jgi:hypothetical protein
MVSGTIIPVVKILFSKKPASLKHLSEKPEEKTIFLPNEAPNSC